MVSLTRGAGSRKEFLILSKLIELRLFTLHLRATLLDEIWQYLRTLVVKGWWCPKVAPFPPILHF